MGDPPPGAPLLVCLAVVLGGCLSLGAAPTGPPSTTATPTPAGAHGSPYPVTIEVTHSAVSDPSVPTGTIPTLTAANLTPAQRAAVRAALEADGPVTWSGQSDERPPARLQTLVAASDRLPPSSTDRDPEAAWRVGREATGYVTLGNTTYALRMVKIAP